MKVPKKLPLVAFTLASLYLTSCKDNTPDPKPTYTIPSTYSFTNMSYSGQTARIQLLDSMKSLMKTAPFAAIAEQDLLDIFNNKNGLFGSTKKLSDKCEASAKAQVEGWIRELAQLSGSQPSNAYLVNPDGLDLAQLIEKTLMGSVFYYQAVNKYLSNIEIDDNTVVVPNEGTAMEHHWDEAFGYFGAPVDFKSYTDADITLKGKDTNGNGKVEKPSEVPLFHASYAMTRDKSSSGFAVPTDRTSFRITMMDAFTKGRAGISNKDLTARDEAKAKIIETWEKLLAATAINYCNSVKNKMGDPSKENALQHDWSEAVAFVGCLKFSNYKKISDSEIQAVIALLGTKPSEATLENLNLAIGKLKTTFGFSDFQASNF